MAIGARHWFVLVILTSLACSTQAPPSPAALSQETGSARPGDGPTPSADQSRPLVIAVGRAPESLGAKPLRRLSGPGNPRTALRAFNAGLVLHDDREQPRPYLAESLPQLDTDSWRVFPDGTMETTYRLRPDLAWHDGAPLTADDFTFAWRVYASPELGVAGSPPMSFIQEVRAQDARTVAIRWRQLYGDADDLQDADFAALPRHILESAFAQQSGDAFVAHPYWVTEYVGLGPYRLARYELGAFIEGEAFGGHVAGRPRIDRIRVVFIGDANTAIANLLSGAVHIAVDSSVPQDQALFLQREWAPTGAGIVLSSPARVRAAHFQLRPEFSNPRAILDARVRKAVASSTDRQTIADALTEGQGQAADTFLLPQAEFYAAAEQVQTKYPYDLRQAERYFNEAGFAKGPDGVYASAAQGRFSLQVATTDANITEGTVLAHVLQQAGIDSSLRIISRAESSNDSLAFHTYSGLLTGGLSQPYLPPIMRFRAAEIPRPETRNMGGNFPGFNHPEFERLVAAYEGSLNRAERNRYAVDMVKLISEEVPAYGLEYSLQFVPYTVKLRGPMSTVSLDTGSWNLHEWFWID